MVRCYHHLRSQSKHFELFHNRNHRYSCLRGKHLFSLSKRLATIQPCHLLSSQCRKLPTSQTGQSLIRFIRSDRKLDIFGEHFELLKSIMYTYVRAKIITGLHQIQVYSGDDSVASFPYRLSAWIAPDSQNG